MNEYRKGSSAGSSPTVISVKVEMVDVGYGVVSGVRGEDGELSGRQAGEREDERVFLTSV
jgi:hypothetical protein